MLVGGVPLAVVGLGVGAAALWLAAAIVAPAYLLPAALLFLIASPQYFAGSAVGGLEWSTIQNVFVVLCLLPLLLRYGIYLRFNPIVAAYVLIGVLSYTLASWHPALSITQPVESFVALTLGAIAYQIRLPGRALQYGFRIIPWLALLSVLVGAVLHALRIWPLVRIEYAGAVRLQGATIPAHLAMLALVGMMCALGVPGRSRKRVVIALLNYGILVLTGTRGALAAGSILVAAHVLIEIREAARGRVGPFVRLAAIALAGIVLTYVYLPQLILRHTGSAVEYGLNTSGRIGAWAFFWSVAKENLVFGRGLGAATVANQGHVHEAFRVPHNEYLRIIVDGGFVGLILVLAAYIWMFRDLYKVWPRGQRKFLIAVGLMFAVYAFVDNPVSTTQFVLPFWLYLAGARDIMRENGHDRAFVLWRGRAKLGSSVA